MAILPRPTDDPRAGATLVTQCDIPASTPELRREQMDRELTERTERGRTVAQLVERGRTAAARPCGARLRALARLAERHRTEFLTLLAEESTRR